MVEAAFWERSHHRGDSGEDVSYPLCAWVTHKNVAWACNCIMNSNNYTTGMMLGDSFSSLHWYTYIVTSGSAYGYGIFQSSQMGMVEDGCCK